MPLRPRLLRRQNRAETGPRIAMPDPTAIAAPAEIEIETEIGIGIAMCAVTAPAIRVAIVIVTVPGAITEAPTRRDVPNPDRGSGPMPRHAASCRAMINR